MRQEVALQVKIQILTHKSSFDTSSDKRIVFLAQIETEFYEIHEPGLLRGVGTKH